MNFRLAYQNDFSDSTYSGLLHLETPVLFSFSDSLCIPPSKESYQQFSKNAIMIHEKLTEGNSGLQKISLQIFFNLKTNLFFCPIDCHMNSLVSTNYIAGNR
jgi:hypothetical protein